VSFDFHGVSASVRAYRGRATFALGDVEFEHDVDVKVREGAKSGVEGRIVHAKREALLALAGPITICSIPQLFDQRRRCPVHTDGRLVFLGSEPAQPSAP
jgi:hypothetical protein